MQVTDTISNNKNKIGFQALYANENQLKSLGNNFMKDWKTVKPRVENMIGDHDIFVCAETLHKDVDGFFIFARKKEADNTGYGVGIGNVNEGKSGIMAALKNAMTEVEEHLRHPERYNNSLKNKRSMKSIIKEVFKRFDRAA